MFRTKTVFVIGAGASSELGFPIGSMLKEEIRRDLNISFDAGRLTSGDRVIAEAFRHQTASDQVNVHTYRRAGHIVRDTLLVAPSIDHSLFVHARDPEAVFCGKLAIARRILLAESASELRTDGQKARVDLGDEKLRRSYLLSLATQLTTGKQELDESLFDNVAFIIFNYDRCVEEFLFHAVKAHYSGTDNQVARVLNAATFIHPYGRLGRLPWQSGDDEPVPFGIDVHPSAIHRVAGNIRTFTERTEDTAFLAKVQGTYSGAERLVFLGFGFADQNMELLAGQGAGAAPLRAITSHAYATSCGISEYDVPHVEKLIRRSLARPNTPALPITLIEKPCAEFFGVLARTLQS